MFCCIVAWPGKDGGFYCVRSSVAVFPFAFFVGRHYAAQNLVLPKYRFSANNTDRFMHADVLVGEDEKSPQIFHDSIDSSAAVGRSAA